MVDGNPVRKLVVLMRNHMVEAIMEDPRKVEYLCVYPRRSSR